jgi:hypothetical protein
MKNMKKFINTQEMINSSEFENVRKFNKNQIDFDSYTDILQYINSCYSDETGAELERLIDEAINNVLDQE